jgi:hypothetical protein
MLKLWLLQQCVASFMAPFRRGTAQRRWEALLRAVIAGRTWSGRLYRMAIDPADAYQAGITEAQKWERAGCPTLYE